jgi:predicted GTPase
VSELGKKINNGLKNDIFKQTITAIHESHLIIVVVDAQKPIGTDEMDMIKYLRKIDKNKHIILCCNKTEKIFD